MSDMFLFQSLPMAYWTNYLDKLGSQACEHNIDPSAWVCDDCFMLRVHVVRQGKYQSIRDEVLEYSLKC